MPITWRNVESANPNAGFQPLQAAGTNINNAFDIFSKVIQQRQANDQANLASADDGAKQAYLSKLQSFKSPEEVAAFEASPEAAAMKQTLTATARGAVMGAGEARVSSTRANTLAANTFDDTLKSRAELPFLAQYNTLLAKGDTAGAAAFQAANVGNVRDWSGSLEKGYVKGRALAADARTDVTNKQVDEIAALSQPGKVADVRFANATRTQRQNLAVQGLNIQGETQTAQQQTNADAQQLRSLSQELAKESADHLANQEVIGRMQQNVSKRFESLGLPKTATGSPDFANMSSVQRQAFDALAKTMGIPGSDVVAGGDTARGDALWQKLNASGKYSPAVLQANAQAIRSAYNSTAPALAGNDLANLTRATAGDMVGFDEQDANSWGYGAGDATARNDYDGLAARVPELLKDNTSGIGKEKDIVYIQRLLRKVALEGIPTKSGEKIVPSVRDMESLIRGSVGGWVDNEKRSTNIETALKDWFQTSDAQKMIADGERSRSFRLKQKMIQTQRELLNPGGVPPKK